MTETRQQNQWYLIENHHYCGSVNARAVSIGGGKVAVFDPDFENFVIEDHHPSFIPIPAEYVGRRESGSIKAVGRWDGEDNNTLRATIDVSNGKYRLISMEVI